MVRLRVVGFGGQRCVVFILGRVGFLGKYQVVLKFRGQIRDVGVFSIFVSWNFFFVGWVFFGIDRDFQFRDEGRMFLRWLGYRFICIFVEVVIFLQVFGRNLSFFFWLFQRKVMVLVKVCSGFDNRYSFFLFGELEGVLCGDRNLKGFVFYYLE